MKHILIFVFVTLLSLTLFAQDASMGRIRGRVLDPTGAAIQHAKVDVRQPSRGLSLKLISDEAGVFIAPMLFPGTYELFVSAPNMAPRNVPDVKVEVGSSVELDLRMSLVASEQTVEVSGGTPAVETQSSEVAQVIDERAINELPLNGRRFTDLVLQDSAVTQDPRGLTSASNGDLAFGGVRGYQSTILVDGGDNTNSFFAQGRGRYRAPYQFSNEVVQEFRVSSNAYGAELGRAGGGVVNVVTKSGTNEWHGSAFYYLRDSSMNAQHPFADVKPEDRQHQFGFTLGGRLKKNRAFFLLGWDQHIFHVPTEVRFVNGTSTVTAQTGDYEPADQAQVQAAAAQLSSLAGSYKSAMVGNAGFAKVDWSLSPKHYMTLRYNTSRYNGDNNVFLDPASPITTYAVSENGTENVHTETFALAMTSALTMRTSSHLRVQFSRDVQDSSPNSTDVRVRVADVIDAFGRSSILPRQTLEKKLHISDTISLESGRNSWKFGGDVIQTWIHNYFPLMFGGQYIFDDTRVNPWTFAPATYGMRVTPLLAYAHGVPRYYAQNFGNPDSHPDTREFAFFVQDSLRVTDRLALNVGLRWDRQSFNEDGLEGTPLYPDAGKVPHDGNNFAPRIGVAYRIGDRRPLVVRGGFGMFYTRIPSIYTSSVATDNGLSRQHLFLVNTQNEDAAVFPTYPNPLVSCLPGEHECQPPASLTSKLTSDISAFARDFQTPYVHQGSVSVEREFADRFAVSATYLYVHGQHLIRARDANLPEPTIESYPVFDENDEFTGQYKNVASFGTWQTTRNVQCPFPPCLNDPDRPIPQLGAVNLFESAAESIYHGFTLSARRRMTHGLYFRFGYTFAKAIDNGQDALVAGRPAVVQNAYDTAAERSLSVTDQRHRMVASWVYEPRPFHRDHPVLRRIFNDWKISGVVTLGSGRPVNARVAGDANRDGNDGNDRLPGVSRNSFQGPSYATTDLRVTRHLKAGDGLKLDLVVESFNLMNHENKRVDLSDDGFLSAASSFVARDRVVSNTHYPAHFRLSSGFLQPNNAYAPRQIQFAIRMSF